MPSNETAGKFPQNFFGLMVNRCFSVNLLKEKKIQFMGKLFNQKVKAFFNGSFPAILLPGTHRNVNWDVFNSVQISFS